LLSIRIPDGAILNSDPEVQIAWIQPPRVQVEDEIDDSEEGEEGSEESTVEGPETSES
jgi:hypothetical protein